MNTIFPENRSAAMDGANVDNEEVLVLVHLPETAKAPLIIDRQFHIEVCS